MKASSKHLDKLAKDCLISNIDLSSYIEQDISEDGEKIAALHEIFNAEYGWRVNQIGKQGAVMDWLQGLPTALTIPFYNHEILELAKSWGSIPQDASEKQEDKILANYWNFMAAKLCQLFDKVAA